MNTNATETCRRRMDEIHTHMARLKKAIARRGAQTNPSWADAGDLNHLSELLSAAVKWADMKVEK